MQTPLAITALQDYLDREASAVRDLAGTAPNVQLDGADSARPRLFAA
jgi:hypothetical protein